MMKHNSVQLWVVAEVVAVVVVVVVYFAINVYYYL
jgi:hypothetical protein